MEHTQLPLQVHFYSLLRQEAQKLVTPLTIEIITRYDKTFPSPFQIRDVYDMKMEGTNMFMRRRGFGEIPDTSWVSVYADDIFGIIVENSPYTPTPSPEDSSDIDAIVHFFSTFNILRPLRRKMRWQPLDYRSLEWESTLMLAQRETEPLQTTETLSELLREFNAIQRSDTKEQQEFILLPYEEQKHRIRTDSLSPPPSPQLN